MAPKAILKNLGRPALLAAVGLLLMTVPAFEQDTDFPELDEHFKPLRARFNADVGKVRLVLLLDPT